MRLGLAVLLIAASVAGACESDGRGAYARMLRGADDGIGGPRATGGRGDVLLGNARIRVVISGTAARHTEVGLGAGIIDADLARPHLAAGEGSDWLGALIPGLFVHGFAADATTPIQIVDDGSDSERAVVRTRARPVPASPYLEALAADTLAAPLVLETDYVLAADASHVEIVTRLVNEGDVALPLDGRAAEALLAGVRETSADVTLGLGELGLLGAGNDLFVPGTVRRSAGGGLPRPVGFDVARAVDEAAGLPVQLPAMSGLVADFVATRGSGVSYGFALADDERNLAWLSRDAYAAHGQTASQHGMVLAWAADGRFAALHTALPEELGAGEAFESRRYFVVGGGDVDSIRRELTRVRGTWTGEVSGAVLLAGTGAPWPHAEVHLLDVDERPYTQVRADARGRFRVQAEPGLYFARVTAPGLRAFPATADVFTTRAIEVRGGEVSTTVIAAPAPARLIVGVRDGHGRPVAARVTVVGRYGVELDAGSPTEQLAALALGEAMRPTDLTHRRVLAERERKFVEAEGVTDARGFLDLPVAPSVCEVEGCAHPTVAAYEVVVSHGPEYGVASFTGLALRAGETRELAAVVERVVDPVDYLGVDFGVRTTASLDARATLDARVLEAAASGVELLVMGDAGRTRKALASAMAQGLADSVGGPASFAGTSYTALSASIFPLADRLLDDARVRGLGGCVPGLETPGAAACVPVDATQSMRAQSPTVPAATYLQVEHSRGGPIGYFDAFGLTTFTAQPVTPVDSNDPWRRWPLMAERQADLFAPTRFSLSFDGMQVASGRGQTRLFDFDVPESASDEVVTELRDYRCGDGHPSNTAGAPLLREGGERKYPGTVSDWLRLLERGAVLTATAGSSAAGAFEPVGFPRTYVRLPRVNPNQRAEGTVAAVDELQVVAGLFSGGVTLSNGVFLDVSVRTRSAGVAAQTVVWPTGSLVRYAESNVGREVPVMLTLKTAPWVRVDEVRLWVNGVVERTIAVPKGKLADGRDADDDWLYAAKVVLERDAIIVAEARSTSSLFPVVVPVAERPRDAADAFASLARVLGLVPPFAWSDGVRGPEFVSESHPWALTNPVFVDVDANDQLQVPGNAGAPGAAPQDVCP